MGKPGPGYVGLPFSEFIAVVGSQRIEGSDCLSKTQVHAKTLS